VRRVTDTLSVEHAPLADFLWVLDAPFGRTAAGPYTHTMRQVLEAPHHLLRHNGFCGELNRLRAVAPDIVREARSVARKLVQEARLPRD
jgi:hypothetical protein